VLAGFAFTSKLGTALDEQPPQNRSMASTLVRAVASDRKISLTRESGKKIENPCGVWRFHFRAELSLEPGP